MMLASKDDRLPKTLLAWPEMIEAWMDAMAMGVQESSGSRDFKTCKESRCEESYVAQVSNMADRHRKDRR